MKKNIAVILSVMILAMGGFAQASAENAALEAEMKKFIGSIEKGDTAVFMSYISPDKGLTIMNTIDQGEEGNMDKPMLDSTLTHKELAADLKAKGELYRSIFKPSEDSPNFHDAFANREEKWMLVAGNKFQLIDAETGKPSNAFYVKWEKHGENWYVTEVGRLIS
ncbi:MAG: hypothetical protein KF881_09075 [Acidobacteria bacterium]|nr:hypothetical protein [Acidobacteriota bacterium]